MAGLENWQYPGTEKSHECTKHFYKKITPEEVLQKFEKKFQFDGDEKDWKLPHPAGVFGEFYQFPYLQDMKDNLNNVKGQLNHCSNEDWSAFTRRTDPAGEIPWMLKTQTKAEFVTVSWCKLFECLHSFPLVKGPKFNSLHLCEAPGAFVAALNHYLHSQYPKEEVEWKWLVHSLNPYYEGNDLGRMIIDDRFMLYTLDKWLFHEDFTGDILKRSSVEDIQAECSSRLKQVSLITADGSIDCKETPGEQEDVVATLHFAEVITALSILADGGSFVIKRFTLFEASSVCLMYLLNCVFREVHVFKPCTTRQGTSEVYVVCLDYKRSTEHFMEILDIMKSKLNGDTVVLPLFAKAHLPADFLAQHKSCCELFMNYQIVAIHSNIVRYDLNFPYDRQRSRQMRALVCQEFCRRYHVQTIPDELKILPARECDRRDTKYFMYQGSYAERELLRTTTNDVQIFTLRKLFNDLDKLIDRRYGTILHEDHNGKRREDIQLHLYRGTAYASVNSSMFASLHCLLVCQQILRTAGIDPVWQANMGCSVGPDSAIPFVYNIATDNFYEKQRLFFLSIVEALLGAAAGERAQEITFWNFPFLTHFSVSLLRVISLVAFEELAVTANEPGYVVSLKGRHAERDERETAELAKLQSLLQNNDNVLCFLPITQLHDNPLSKGLLEYNNDLLMHNCRKLLDGDV